MRRRYLIANLSLVSFIVAVLGIPLAVLVARNAWADLENAGQLDRAYLIAPIVKLSAHELPTRLPELVREFTAARGATAIVVDQSGREVVASGPSPARFYRENSGAVRSAFRGEHVIKEGSLLPDASRPLVIAQEWQLTDGRWYAFLIGVPTEDLRRTIAMRWAVLGAGALIAILGTTAMVWFLSAWVLRPIKATEAAVRSLTRGHDVERISVHRGPPELRTLNAHVNHLAGTVQALVERQRFFLADASHQLRNPLVALSLRLENLEPHIADGGRGGYRKILGDIDHLRQTLSEILDISRVVNEEQQITEVDVAAVVADRASSWSVVAWQRHVRIYSTPCPSVFVVARPGALEQALDVLLDNAIRFSPSNGEIAVAVLPGETFVDIHVRDEGPGMTAADRELAVRRHWRLPQGKLAGSGLGLSIATMLVSSSGGQLDLLAAEGSPGLDARIRLAAPVVTQSVTKTKN
ncbi:sensor histidine kinase [Streptacidiphilus sp. MAP5-3]|uniref:sensor histidine kinase n=1 Tax=unclassified Streptacidiphilus TaxID=2643834 RepID=UPI003516EDEC